MSHSWSQPPNSTLLKGGPFSITMEPIDVPSMEGLWKSQFIVGDITHVCTSLYVHVLVYQSMTCTPFMVNVCECLIVRWMRCLHKINQYEHTHTLYIYIYIHIYTIFYRYIYRHTPTFVYSHMDTYHIDISQWYVPSKKKKQTFKLKPPWNQQKKTNGTPRCCCFPSSSSLPPRLGAALPGRRGRAAVALGPPLGPAGAAAHGSHGAGGAENAGSCGKKGDTSRGKQHPVLFSRM